MAWAWLISAGILEIGFAILLKLSAGFTKPMYTLGFAITAALSFYCLTRSMEVIPIGTAYTIWTGIGSAGIVCVGILFFNEALTMQRIALIFLLISAIIGLKLTTPV